MERYGPPTATPEPLPRIDAATGVPALLRVGHYAYDMDARKGIVAVSVQRTDGDVTLGLHGRIAVVALKDDTLDSNTSTDPVGVQSWNADQQQFHYATCAKLFNYPDRSGTAGTRLEPEVAAGWPKVTNGGRTFTFTIRTGYGFSPPSHERVSAESFQHEIERVLRQPGPTSRERLSDVVGAEAYRSGRAPHVSGVKASGSTLTIRLAQPSTDLPARLAAPAFCAVPAGLASVPFGLPYPIPTAGPYFLADRSRSVLVLEPNPNYHGPRARRLDAIVYRVGIDVPSATLRIRQGTVDYVHAADAALGSGTSAANASGYRLTADNSTVRLALNRQRPLFADVRARRALAYAIDRRALARVETGGEFMLATGRLLPPSLAPFGAGLYPLTARLGIARRLIEGRHVRAVYAALADGEGKLYQPHAVALLRAQLGAVGVTVVVRALRQTATPTERAALLARADIADAPSGAGVARDAVSYLQQLPFLRSDDLAQLRRIALLATTARERAAARMAARLERDADYVPVADGAVPELTSARLGCLVHQSVYGDLDLAALCLKPR